MQSTILHQNSNIVCGIVGNTKSMNNVAYKSFIVKSISVKKPSSVPTVQTRYKIFLINKSIVCDVVLSEKGEIRREHIHRINRH